MLVIAVKYRRGQFFAIVASGEIEISQATYYRLLIGLQGEI